MGLESQENPTGSDVVVDMGESDFYDGSYALYNLYNEKTDELDKAFIEGWLEYSRDLMVLGGLISAAISSFLAQSYLNSLQPQAAEDASQSTPKTTIVSTQVLWFLGLGASLVSATLSGLLQSWIRRYMLVTRIQRNPRGLALIRACATRKKILVPLQPVVDILHVLLDFSIATFIVGLIRPLNASNLISLNASTSNFATIFICTPFYLWYCGLTVIPFFLPTIYATATTSLVLNLVQNLKTIFLIPFILSGDSLRTGSEAFLVEWVTARRVGHDHQVPEDVIKRETPSLDKDIVSWLLRHLRDDEEVERFLESIPSFYDSRIVKQPEGIFKDFYADRMPRAILSFIIRTLSSATLPNETKQKRIKLSFRVVELDPYLLERTFFHALKSPLRIDFHSVHLDSVLAAGRFAILATCIIAVPTGYRLQSDSLRDIVGPFQHEFCILWNQLRDSVEAGGGPGSHANLVLPNIRTIYNTLHSTTMNPDLTPANYPPCTIH